MPRADYDIVIVGGGINGAGIARDAAGRGYSVLLAEKGDLGGGTSSGSTKLIHGGLRYLEHYEFRLVREALREREVLWGLAPHIIHPMRFVLPHHKGLRPAWLLRLGLFLYDHLGGRDKLPATRDLDLRGDPLGRVLKPGYRRAFEYSDCRVDDARLVVLNALDAAENGAVIRPRTAVQSIARRSGVWEVVLLDTLRDQSENVTANLVVNATGPWVGNAFSAELGAEDAAHVRLVKGSHMVVPKLHDDPRALFFQNADGRIIFAIPYQGDFTLIGTTDADFSGDPADAEISAEEEAYLCAAASEYFARAVTQADIVWTYAAVRPLHDDGASKAQEATRDYLLRLTGGEDEAQLLSVIGGKLTTYRRLAEAALDHINSVFGRKTQPWTARAPLPGGDFTPGEDGSVVARLSQDYPWLETAHAERLIQTYGTRAWRVLGSAQSLSDIGSHFGGTLYAAELRYLVDVEWARSAEDVLWRRTKLGLLGEDVDPEGIAAFMAWHANQGTGA